MDYLRFRTDPVSVPLNDGDRFLYLCKLLDSRDSAEEDSEKQKKDKELNAELNRSNVKRLKQLLGFGPYKKELEECLVYGPFREGFKPSRWDKLLSLRMVEVIRNLFVDIHRGWDIIVGREYAHAVDEATFETLCTLTPAEVDGIGVDIGLDEGENEVVYNPVIFARLDEDDRKVIRDRIMNNPSLFPLLSFEDLGRAQGLLFHYGSILEQVCQWLSEDFDRGSKGRVKMENRSRVEDCFREHLSSEFRIVQVYSYVARHLKSLHESGREQFGDRKYGNRFGYPVWRDLAVLVKSADIKLVESVEMALANTVPIIV
jgi:hypothetical protein